MSNPIQSSFGGGTPSGAISTNKGSMSTEDWIDSHFTALAGAAPTDTTSLTTQWTCDGGTESETTTRNPGEGWIAFFRRHRQAAEAAMTDCPPEA